jgi:hypothetical protein
MSSGSLIENNFVHIGVEGATGIINQTGGLISFQRPNATAGSSAFLGSSTYSGTAIYNFYKGNLETSRNFGLGLATTAGTTTFNVYGYDAGSSIQIGGVDGGDGAWTQGARTTLSLHLDGGTTTGVTPINVVLGTDGALNAYDGVATFESGSLLDLDFNSSTRNGEWRVLTAEGGIVDNGLALHPDANSNYQVQWEFELRNGDTELWVISTTNIAPEPSTLGLLLIGGTALAASRRKKA